MRGTSARRCGAAGGRTGTCNVVHWLGKAAFDAHASLDTTELTASVEDLAATRDLLDQHNIDSSFLAAINPGLCFKRASELTNARFGVEYEEALAAASHGLSSSSQAMLLYPFPSSLPSVPQMLQPGDLGRNPSMQMQMQMIQTNPPMQFHPLPHLGSSDIIGGVGGGVETSLKFG